MSQIVIPQAGWAWLAVVRDPVYDRVKAIKKCRSTTSDVNDEKCYIAIYLKEPLDILTSFDLPASMFTGMTYNYPYAWEDLTHD